MQQDGELVRVKTRIRALAEKTTSNGCTEAEALSAAELVGRLLEPPSSRSQMQPKATTTSQSSRGND